MTPPNHVETMDPVLSVDSLDVSYETAEGSVQALRNISFDMRPGEILGVAGESGSGKSTLGLAILQYLGENGSVTGGDITFNGDSLLDLSMDELRSLRGNRIAHIPQDPKKSLNPSIRVGKQIAEAIDLHQDVDDAAARAVDILETVNITEPAYNAKRYPHELSGGMQQRVLIAMALSCNPDLLVLDEPTTGLDVTTQAKILDLINDLRDELSTSMLLITHDLGVIAETADRVSIIYAGELMELGSVEAVFSNPTHPYTQGLLASLPEIENTKSLESIPGQIPSLTEIPTGCIFADRCEFAEDECRTAEVAAESVPHSPGHITRCRRWEAAAEEPIRAEVDERSWNEPGDEIIETEDLKRYYGEESVLDRLLSMNAEPPVQAVNGVNLAIRESEAVGLVGESGCGKSTFGRTLLGLLDPTDGTVSYKGDDLTEMTDAELKEFRSECQIVFQNPESTLNPKKTVYRAIERPLELLTDLSERRRRRRVEELLNEVGLGPEYASRYPHELSGGEIQRVAIARAFAPEPSFVVLDEPVSALDVSIQASIMSMLKRLRREYDTSYLFISHDLSVVKHVCDRIAVMYLGKIAEVGPSEEVFKPPYHPYTRALLSSVPSPNPGQQFERVRLEGEVPSARDQPSGCPFHSRCPQKIGDVCERDVPEPDPVAADDGTSHYISCHLDENGMNRPLDRTAVEDE
ncbi:ABC transporter ATP-binding protein [Salinigranum marinum]|uniref:ABC transporter ATP-binding protein n=1 Tax=Salinigranum marinum TaxID=1515595 RepID=UPI002989F8D3|nr:ABC transporter ATP-binding protein [Salinigranum marinum]